MTALQCNSVYRSPIIQHVRDSQLLGDWRDLVLPHLWARPQHQRAVPGRGPGAGHPLWRGGLLLHRRPQGDKQLQGIHEIFTLDGNTYHWYKFFFFGKLLKLFLLLVSGCFGLIGNVVNIVVLCSQDMRSKCFNNLLSLLNLTDRYNSESLSIFLNVIKHLLNMTIQFPFLFIFQRKLKSWKYYKTFYVVTSNIIFHSVEFVLEDRVLVLSR